jgi:hypothetical protein
MSLEFDPNDAESVVNGLNFPRLPGSEGSKRGVAVITEMFSKIGIDMVNEPFIASKLMFGQVLQIEMAATIAVAWVMAAIAWLSPAWNLAIVLATIVAVTLAVRALSAGTTKPVTNGIATCNLTCSIPPLEAKRGTVIYMAHQDTKSQTLAALHRVICFVGWAATILAGLGIFAIMGVLHLLMIGGAMPPSGQSALDVLNLVADGVVIALTCCTTPLAFNKVGNASPGALDNASGVSVVYLIGKQLKAHPFKSLEARLVINGAEELGLFGAKDYVAKHGGELDRASTWVINIDTIGCKGGAGIEVWDTMGFPIPRKVSPFLSKVANDAAGRLGKDILHQYLPFGAATDRMVFSRRGYEGIDFGNRGSASVIHTRRDTPDRFDPALASAVASVAHLMGKYLDGTDKI